MNTKIEGITYDNSTYAIKEIFHNFNDSYKIQLLNISDRKIADLLSENSLLIYTNPNNEKDDIKSCSIFNITHDDKLCTNNIAGFIGTENTTLTIKSRFSKDDDKDYFLHYMLQKVFNINLSSLEHNICNDDVFSFMPYLFKHYFMNALYQGIYKKYVWNKYNNSRVKGSIDISRHIKYNFMNNGNVAYNLREHSYDNNITQLIRHTIEYIKNSSIYSFILEDEEIKPFIKDIIYITESYSYKLRYNVINQNIKSHIHPYYYEYEPLRKICLQILMQDELKYGRDKDKIYGVLFDIAWLWEEYLALLLQQVNGVIHTYNKKSSGYINMLKDAWRAYPDYYIKDHMVMDAKYKHMKNIEKIDRNDRNQILSYMYILNVKKGLFIYPDKEESIAEKNLNSEYNDKLKDYKIYKYGFKLPHGNIKNMQDFKSIIIKEEEKFISFIETLKI